jgi:DNA-directed RNA polymerase subunit F
MMCYIRNTGELLVKSGEEINEDIARKIAEIHRSMIVEIRSVLTCEIQARVCA